MVIIPDFYVMVNPCACLAVRRVCPNILLFIPGRHAGRPLHDKFLFSCRLRKASLEAKPSFESQNPTFHSGRKPELLLRNFDGINFCLLTSYFNLLPQSRKQRTEKPSALPLAPRPELAP